MPHLQSNDSIMFPWPQGLIHQVLVLTSFVQQADQGVIPGVKGLEAEVFIEDKWKVFEDERRKNRDTHKYWVTENVTDSAK